MVRTAAGYRLHRWGTAPTWEDVPVATPGDGQVRVAVEACGVGLTVLNCINGDLADDADLLPRVPGHELVGRVDDVGPGVDRALLGRRVVAYFYLSCFTCAECVAGRESRCVRLAGWVGVHTDGGYAPYAVIPAGNAIAIPESLDPVSATVIPDALATPVHVCLDRARLLPGDRVAIVGAGGGVGAHLVQMARLCGARVAGLEVGDAKLALVEELGATAVRSDRFAALDADLWPEGPPTVIVDLVGSEDSLAWSTAALATGGRLVLLTTFRDQQVRVDPRALVFGEATIVASRYAGRADVARAARLLAAGQIRPIVGAVVEPPDVPALHDDLRAGSLLGRGALTWNPGAAA